MGSFNDLEKNTFLNEIDCLTKIFNNNSSKEQQSIREKVYSLIKKTCEKHPDDSYNNVIIPATAKLLDEGFFPSKISKEVAPGILMDVVKASSMRQINDISISN